MFELHIKENLKVPNERTFKDNYTNTLYKRPFLIEKIKKDIYQRNHHNLLKSNNSDKHLLKLKKNLKKKIKRINPINSNISASNNYDHLYKFIGKLNNNLQIKSIKNKQSIIPAKRILRRQRSDFDLPMINPKRIIKEPMNKNKNRTIIFLNDNSKEKNQEKITNSEIIDSKDVFENKPRIIKIRSFINTSRKSNISLNNEPKLFDINEMNEKYNMKLNSGNTGKQSSKIFHGKKYTIIGMLNKLFQYYSSNESHNNQLSSNNYNQTSNYMNLSKSNNSIFLNNDTNNVKNSSTNKLMMDTRFKYDPNTSSDININNTYEASGEDTNTFLTKLNINNREQLDNKEKEMDMTKFINNRCSLSDMNRINKEIIDNNKNIKIDCLMSKIEQNINIKKILYKYLGKSIYQLQKDPAYIRLKSLERKIIEILKKEGG
jgi:hypothetical protein